MILAQQVQHLVQSSVNDDETVVNIDSGNSLAP